MNDLAGMERALVVIAVCVVVQTLLVLGAALGAWLAYRRTAALASEQLKLLHAKTDDIAASVQKAVDAVDRGTEAFRLVMDDARTTVQAVSTAVDDARDSMRTVSDWTGNVVTAMSTPKAAAAYGVMRGVQWWRRRRETKARASAIASSPGDLSGLA